MSRMLTRAIIIAAQAHSGQTDKGGRPYILHPLRVMMNQLADLEQICAVLHDVIEDSAVSLEDLRIEGFDEEVLRTLELLTNRDKGSSYDAFIKRICESGNQAALRIKLADLEDNLDSTRIALLSPADKARVEKYSMSRDKIVAALKG